MHERAGSTKTMKRFIYFCEKHRKLFAATFSAEEIFTYKKTVTKFEALALALARFSPFEARNGFN
jgi:hypothetical protein